MEAVMGSSSPFPCLKLVSCRDNVFGKSLPFYHSRNTLNNKVVDFKHMISVSSSRRGVRGVALSSFNTRAEVRDHEFLIKAEAETETVRVKFQLQRECTFGQNFLIAGEDALLGSWDPNNAIPLTWSDGHLWSADIDIPIGKCIKFKFIMQESDGIFTWQPGPDRVLECFQTDKILTLCEDWEIPDSRRIMETDPTLNQETEQSPVRINGTQEQKGYALNLNQALVSNEGFPVLVPDLSQLPPNDEPETAMVSAGADIPELDSKEEANALNSNSRPAITSIHENQESCENKHQETKQIGQEQDHRQDSQPMKSCLRNDIQWENNIMQKLLNIFSI